MPFSKDSGIFGPDLSSLIPFILGNMPVFVLFIAFLAISDTSTILFLASSLTMVKDSQHLKEIVSSLQFLQYLN